MAKIRNLEHARRVLEHLAKQRALSDERAPYVLTAAAEARLRAPVELREYLPEPEDSEKEEQQ